MGARADYTFKQARAMSAVAVKSWSAHWLHCEQCVQTDMYGDRCYCEDGAQLKNVWQKWRRRSGYAAKREGIAFTV